MKNQIRNFLVGKNIGSDHLPTITTVNSNTMQQLDKMYLNWQIFKRNLEEKHVVITPDGINRNNFNKLANNLNDLIVQEYKQSFEKIGKKNKFIFLSKTVRNLLKEKKL